MPDFSYLTSKIISGIGGLIGGLTLFYFWKPKRFSDYFFRPAFSTGISVLFTPIVLYYLSLHSSLDNMLWISFSIGFLSWGFISLITRTFRKFEREDKDLLDIFKQFRNNKKD